MVTKNDFEEAYKKFPPSRYELFFMKYISIHSIQENKWVLLIPIMLMIPFFFELIFCTLKMSQIFQIIPSCIYIFLTLTIGIYWISIYSKKEKRLKRIRTYLGVSKKEYQDLINMYYYHRYKSTEKYIKFNSK
jgi:hypothetical protein